MQSRLNPGGSLEPAFRGTVWCSDPKSLPVHGTQVARSQRSCAAHGDPGHLRKQHRGGTHESGQQGNAGDQQPCWRQQTFLGPVLSIPYSIAAPYKGASPQTGVYVVFPIQGDATIRVRTEERHRSLFKVPVFQADLNFDAAFDLSGVPSAAPADAVLDWSRAGIVVGVSNAHGALADGTLTVNSKTVTFVPAEKIGDANSEQRLPLTYLGALVNEVAQPNATFRVSAALRFSGAQRLAVLAYGKTSHVSVEGDWPSPGFDGPFVPIKRTVSTQGFIGEWLVPFI